MNALISTDWTNTLNTRRQANVWWSWIKGCLSIFLLLKRWQFLSEHFVVFQGKNVRMFYKNFQTRLCPECNIEHLHTSWKVLQLMCTWLARICWRRFASCFIYSFVFQVISEDKWSDQGSRQRCRRNYYGCKRLLKGSVPLQKTSKRPNNIKHEVSKRYDRKIKKTKINK